MLMHCSTKLRGLVSKFHSMPRGCASVCSHIDDQVAGEIGNDGDDGDDADDGDDEDDDGSDKDVDRLVFSLCFTLCGNVLGLSANVCLQPTKGLGHIEANLPPLNVEEVPEIFGLSFGSSKTLA